MRSKRVRWITGLLAFAGACATAAPPEEIVLDRDDIDVARSAVVKPGAYRVVDGNGDGVLRIVADGVTVTMTGVTLDGSPEGNTPDQFEGVGVAVVGRAKVRIVGGALRGFRVGLRGDAAPGLELDGVDVSGNRAMRLRSTPAREDASDWLWPHENDRGEWETRYGAGISLRDCEGATVTRCRARGSQNGLLLTRCQSTVVHDNDFSFLSGWGIAMYRCTHCEIVRNRCDFCVRGYSHGVYARGQDSAGLLVFEQCSDNLFAGNSATHGGDGFFLYAGHETTQRTGEGGCNDNRVDGNDFSQAVANGIEATFSSGNQFVGNWLAECDHGIWAGYSYGTEIRGNTMRGCANGVSIEHGHHNTIEENWIAGCRCGIHLWWDDDTELLASVYGQKQDTSSSHNSIRGNSITGGGAALRIAGDTDSCVEGNMVSRADVGLDARGTTAFAAFAGNDIEAALSVRCETAAPLALGVNTWTPWSVAGPQRVDAAAPQVEPRLVITGDRHVPGGITPRGREHIVIGEWGPLDPRLPALVPFGSSGADAATLRIVGAGLPFRVVSLTEGFVAEPAAGIAPAVVRVRASAHTESAAIPWQAAVRIGDADFAASGVLVSAPWRVRQWAWQKDPRTDAAAWSALLALPPLDERTAEVLEFDWQAGAPAAGVPADRFATVAETTLTLPAGTWRLHTVSDDGIRVLVDGEVVIEDWTWHAPKEIECLLELTAGPHTVRVEHFEIDGWAALRCWLEPVPRRP